MAKAKKLPSGSWRVQVYAGNDGNGKRIYKSFTAPTKREAEFLAAEFVAKNKYAPQSMTVGDAIDRYIASKDGILSPTTINGYRNLRKFHLQGIMNTKIDKLTREKVQSEINAESKRYSAKTVSNAHGLLSAALTMQNPDFVLHTTLPRKVKKLRVDLPTSEDVIRAVYGTNIELPVLLALCLCLRMSEVRGLRKDAIDGNSLHIERVIVTVQRKDIEKELLKTDDSRRIVELPDYLRDRMLQCETEYITELSSKAIYGRFVKAMRNAGFDHVRFHDLRHISASDMHARGISDKVASERGGWAGTQTMKQVYQHSFSSDRRKADKIMNDYYASMLDKMQHEMQHEDSEV